MKWSVIPIVLVVAVCVTELGCDKPIQDEKPVVASSAPPPAEAPKVDPTKQETSRPGDNPSRIFQLRDLAKATLIANGHKVQAWIMNTDAKREEGMMFLTAKDVRDDQGMIFVFPDSSRRSFWMHNTILALDIVYIDPKGKVLNVQKGKPEDDTSLPSDGAAKYVLELKQGIASKLGIKNGTRITLPANVTASE